MSILSPFVNDKSFIGFTNGFEGGTSLDAFSPRSLGGNIIIFDPSDRSTLYRDSTGTTPVTAPGQEVGLMLDKGQGLKLGPEMVTNGDFSSGSAGWTLGTGWVIGGGTASFSGDTAGNFVASITVTAGAFYAVTLDVSGVSGSVSLRLGSGGTVLAYIGAGSGSRQYIVAATSGAQFVVRAEAAATITIHRVSVRALPGHHAFQTGATSVRPIYRVDGDGRPYLEFDGVDDWMQTGTITPGTDKVQIFAGVRKLSDAGYPLVVELSAGANISNGSFNLIASGASPGSAGWSFLSRGTASAQAQIGAGYASPITNVVTGLGDISADRSILRANGAQIAQSTADQGTSDYLAYPLYLGRRAGSALPFNGHLYGLILRFGPTLTDAQIAATEKWIARRTGVTL